MPTKPLEDWIPMAERKPERGQYVEVDIGWHCQCRYWGCFVPDFSDDLVVSACPTHWRPVNGRNWKPVVHAGGIH